MNYQYIPKKLHPNLKPLVEACLVNDIGFDFWGDDPASSLTTAVLVRRSDKDGVQVEVSDEAIKIWTFEVKAVGWGPSKLKRLKWTCIEDFVAFLKNDS